MNPICHLLCALCSLSVAGDEPNDVPLVSVNFPALMEVSGKAERFNKELADGPQRDHFPRLLFLQTAPLNVAPSGARIELL